MPIYEYRCPKCKTAFAIRRSFSDSDKPGQCPKCNSSAQRLISSFACKMGSGIQASEKPFRGNTTKELESPIPIILINQPPNRVELLSPPAKKNIHARRKKK